MSNEDIRCSSHKACCANLSLSKSLNLIIKLSIHYHFVLRGVHWLISSQCLINHPITVQFWDHQLISVVPELTPIDPEKSLCAVGLTKKQLSGLIRSHRIGEVKSLKIKVINYYKFSNLASYPQNGLNVKTKFIGSKILTPKNWNKTISETEMSPKQQKLKGHQFWPKLHSNSEFLNGTCFIS